MPGLLKDSTQGERWKTARIFEIEHSAVSLLRRVPLEFHLIAFPQRNPLQPGWKEARKATIVVVDHRALLHPARG
jgi:hypothetical protein